MIPCTYALQEKLVARRLYNILFYLLLPGILARMWWRGRRAPAYRQRIMERLALALPKRHYDLWVHAVSVGETLAAVPLVKRLLEVYPDLSIMVTNMTPTGSERAQSLLGDKVGHHYLPWDFYMAQQCWLKAVRPRLLIIMETELWPNVLWAAHRHGVKVLLANARLSQRSAHGYGRWSALVQPMLSCLDSVAAQETATAERFIHLGVPKNRVTVTGSLKFDMPQPILNRMDLRCRWHVDARVILVAGSTHEGEESLVLEAFRGLLGRYPSALLILVPRHPERFADVERLLNTQQWRWQKRSDEQMVARATQI
ncbi:MAG: 3-deoxy-D-manno-octulosonic acid transferase, partial [Pseudomonadales bacterium]|nr:3-deoxy-D-manno-octulosonic acid transferase [Pseudomonadales bacterium]